MIFVNKLWNASRFVHVNIADSISGKSLSDIEKILAKQNKQLSIAYGEADQIFSEIINQYEIANVFSHEETGLKLTYEQITVRLLCFKRPS